MKATPVVGLIVALAGPAYAGQDPLGAAKDLYASAAYEEALSTLSRLSDGATPDVARQIDQYRAFCLFALGRTTEAEQMVEALIRRDPLVKLAEGEVSPRIETMFATVRKRVLPSLIREEYRIARSALDSQDLKRAEPHLARVSRMLTEVRDSGDMDETLSDLSLLVDGFLGLSRATAEQQARAAEAAAAALAATAAAPAPSGGATVSALSGGAEAPATSGNAAAQQLRTAAIYSGPGDAHLSPPVVVDQTVPPVPPSIGEWMKTGPQKSVVLEVVINEKGYVEDVEMKITAQPFYDSLVLKSARQWKYRPATMDGVPVKFRKSVTIVLANVNP